jgi:hypothetical protein
VTLRGDVELHVRASSFISHGHATDLAYRNVILHVVFEDDVGRDTLLPGGGTAPVVALAQWVSRRAGELQHWLERPLLWQEPCHDAVLRLGADGVAAALDHEGDRRFEERVERWRDEVSMLGIEQALYAGLLEALGFGGNSAAMRALAKLLPWHELDAWSGVLDRRRDRMIGLLLGAAGLLPSQRASSGAIDSYVAELDAGLSPRVEMMKQDAWKLWGVRPANHPVRRIAAAASLLSRLGRPSVALGALDAVRVNNAIAPLLVKADGFWVNHYDVCSAPCILPAALIGRSRALEMLINVVLPIASASGDAALDAQARALYARLPRPAAYGSTKFIENALGSAGIPVQINARRAQGLLGLNHDWCTQNGCGRCVLSR